MASCEEMEVVFPKPLVQFWMGKAREWTEATAPSAQLDACRHLDKLRVFLQQVLGALELAVRMQANTHTRAHNHIQPPNKVTEIAVGGTLLFILYRWRALH